MRIRTKLLLAFVAVLGVVLVAATLSIREIHSLHGRSLDLGMKNAPLADASMEVKLAATTAHLWFEEIINGSEGKEMIDKVWALLDESLWYCEAIVNGGQNAEGKFYPVEDPQVEGKILSVKASIQEFIQIARQRFEARFDGQADNDQALDDRFDAVFERFIQAADEAEEMLHDKMRKDAQQVDEDTIHATWLLVFANLLGLLVAGLAIWYISREIMRQVGGEPAHIAAIAGRVAAGDLDIRFDTGGNAATGIYAAIRGMVDNLRAMNREREDQDWLKTGQARLGEQTSGEQDLQHLAENVVNFLTPYVGAQVGAFYLAEDGADGGPRLRMLASHAYVWRKNADNVFKIGEGMVGQAAYERKHFVVAHPPEDYLRVQSGLGESAPRAILVTPFLYEGEVKGVLELATLGGFSDIQLEFLRQAMPALAIAVNTAESRARMQTLLEQSQAQAKQLQKQTAELELQQASLQQANEELQSQSEELQAQTEELQTQQEELRQTNEELEERTKELERQRGALNQQNLELEKAQAIVQAKAEELALASKYKSEFLANMSHELRTPLNSLLILAQLLADNKDGNLTDKQIECARTIRSSGGDLLTLINEILDLSKIEAGRVELQPEDMRLADLAASLEQKFRHVAEDRGLSFSITQADDLPAHIHTDPQRLKQVINNLLSNAFKFTHQGGIGVDIRRAAEGLLITVSDTGIGIPLDKQKIVFEPFQQADGSTNRKYGGTGLGLSISRELVHLLGGEIRLDSEPGKGSRFSVFLPLRVPPAPHSALPPALGPDAPAAAPQPPASVPPPREPIHEIADDRDSLQADDKSLLIVEDDADFAKILLELAREKGFKCLVALDGGEGLQLAERYQPKAMLLDVALPQVDGWTVMERLKLNPDTRHIPVHFVSGSEQQMDAKRMGAIGYSLKPVSMAELGDAFKKIEQFISKTVKKLLIVAEAEHRRHILEILGDGEVEVMEAASRSAALKLLRAHPCDCLILDAALEHGAGLALLDTLATEEALAGVPVVIYSEHPLGPEAEAVLEKHTGRLTLKAVRSPERLLDEATLFLHQVEASLPQPQRQMLRMVHDKEAIFTDKKVLIVDDDIRNTFALATALENKGMEIGVAKNGRECLDLLRKRQDFDLVLMDIMMPEMDGYEAMRKIREQPRFRKLPIIALTAKAMKGDRAKCIESGASDYLAKPIDTDKLLSLMRVWLYQ